MGRFKPLVSNDGHVIRSYQCAICGSSYNQQRRLYAKAKWQDRCALHRRSIAQCASCGKEVWHSSVTLCKTCSNKSRAEPARRCVGCSRPISRKAVSRCITCHNASQARGGRRRSRFNASKRWALTRSQCFSRDDYTCQRCHRRGGYLEAHHKQPWAKSVELRFVLTNLLTLCRPCHLSVHKEMREAA
jgi:5-methylcytosine-specific restriction endonuclease McrA